MPRNLAPPPEALVEGLLYPGEICIIAGAPSVGKTRFQLHLLHGLATGQEGWWGCFPPMPVLYCSQRSWKVTCAQLRTVGINELPDNFHCFCPPDLSKAEKTEFNRSPTDFLTHHVINKDNPPKVVVLDTLITYLPHDRNFNFNNYSDLTKGCDDIYYWAQHWQCSVPILHHTAKQKTDSRHDTATERILGSQAIMAVAISACILEHYTSDDPTYVKIHFMSHLARLHSPRFFHGDEFREVTEDEVSVSPREDRPVPKLGDVETQVFELVPFELTSFKAIASLCVEKHKSNEQCVYRALNSLGHKGLIEVDATRKDSKQKLAMRIKPQMMSEPSVVEEEGWIVT
jgi:hypothetical protein